MATVRTPAPIVRASREGARRWFAGGGVHTWKATSEETDGAFLLFEMTLDAGKATPLHTHPDSDEAMYVLTGELLVHLDGDEHPVGPGGLVVAPRGVPHAFLVASGPASVLCLHDGRRAPGRTRTDTGNPFKGSASANWATGAQEAR